MQSNRIGFISLCLVVHLSNFDFPSVYAEDGPKNDKDASYAYTLTGEELKKAGEIIEAKFKRLFSLYVLGGGEKPLELSYQKKNQEKIESLGFNDLSELENVKARDYLAISYVRLDHLRNFKSESELVNLIDKRASFIFSIPVKEKAQKTDSISQPFAVVAPVKDAKDHLSKLRITQYGPSKVFQLLFEARQELDTKVYSLVDAHCTCFIVWIPALNQYLLGDVTSEEFKIKVIDNGMKRLGLGKGEYRPAYEVFEALSKEAQKKKYELPPWPFGQPQVSQKPQP